MKLGDLLSVVAELLQHGIGMLAAVGPAHARVRSRTVKRDSGRPGMLMLRSWGMM